MAMAFSSQCCSSSASSTFQHAQISGSTVMPSFLCGTATRFQQQLSGCRLSSGALLRWSNKARLVLKGRSIRKLGEVVCEVGTLAEIEAVPLDDTGFSKIPASQGVYAIYDKQGDLQFVGMSRRVATSVQGHVRDLPELCGSVKVAVVDAVDRDGLRQAWQAWVEEHIKSAGSVPPGNAPGNTTWAAKRRPTKQDLKLKPSQNTQLTVPLEKLIDKVVKEFGVVAFIKGSRTAPQCGFSHRVLTILNEQGVEYETVNVLDEEHNSGVREAIKTYSQWPTIPQVFVGGEFVGGADVMAEMAESGEIKKMFTELKAKN